MGQSALYTISSAVRETVGVDMCLYRLEQAVPVQWPWQEYEERGEPVTRDQASAETHFHQRTNCFNLVDRPAIQGQQNVKSHHCFAELMDPFRKVEIIVSQFERKLQKIAAICWCVRVMSFHARARARARARAHIDFPELQDIRSTCTVVKEPLVRFQQQISEPSYKLQQVVDMHSTFHILSRLYEQREPVGGALVSLRTDLAALSSAEHHIISDA
ncbi:hypothetical protein E1301_Tti017957 [Triplophysa tibetana]|uniref:Uncharacterized protein n=1 Tax=Triplophysa tibetana TaxID=1572043 RepID=A0A5A9NDB6_9TELE|nr:hypothetical protein E1301_Tti017957 [Triplophysa tibetana]